MRFIFAAAIAVQVLICLVGAASAQSLPALPAVDAINASVQTGVIAPYGRSTVPNTEPLTGLWGFGIESEFFLPIEGSNFEGTLALGLNFLNLEGEIGNGRRLRGGLRDLPVLSVYMGHKKVPVYLGLSFGITELKDGRLHTTPPMGQVDPGPIRVSGSGISPAIALGIESKWAFAEVGYVGRFFPSVAYDGIPASGFPADLGERLYTGGFMLRIGVTLPLKKEPAPSSASTSRPRAAVR